MPSSLFLALELNHTQGWDKLLLNHVGSTCSASYPRVAEGDILSVLIPWMYYSQFSYRLSLSAEEEGDIYTSFKLSNI